MNRRFPLGSITTALVLAACSAAYAAEIRTAGKPARLDIRTAGEHSIRVTLRPTDFQEEFPFTPALAERTYAPPAISLRTIDQPVKAEVGSLRVEVQPNPLRVIVTNAQGQMIQDVNFQEDGNLSFLIDDQPLLGMGEGDPQAERDWRNQPVEFDRRGRDHEMRLRWQSNSYGSRKQRLRMELEVSRRRIKIAELVEASPLASRGAMR